MAEVKITNYSVPYVLKKPGDLVTVSASASPAKEEGCNTTTYIRIYREGNLKEGNGDSLCPDEEVSTSYTFVMPEEDVTIQIKALDANLVPRDTVEKTIDVIYLVKGTVTDETGTGIENATVEGPYGQTATTNADGSYILSYSKGFSGFFTASKSGYESETKGITVNPGENILDFTLTKKVEEEYNANIVKVKTDNIGVWG